MRVVYLHVDRQHYWTTYSLYISKEALIDTYITNDCHLLLCGKTFIFKKNSFCFPMGCRV